MWHLWLSLLNTCWRYALYAEHEIRLLWETFSFRISTLSSWNTKRHSQAKTARSHGFRLKNPGDLACVAKSVVFNDCVGIVMALNIRSHTRTWCRHRLGPYPTDPLLSTVLCRIYRSRGRLADALAIDLQCCTKQYTFSLPLSILFDYHFLPEVTIADRFLFNVATMVAHYINATNEFLLIPFWKCLLKGKNTS